MARSVVAGVALLVCVVLAQAQALVLPGAGARLSVGRASVALSAVELAVLNPSARSLSFLSVRERQIAAEVALGFVPGSLVLMPDRQRLVVLGQEARQIALVDVAARSLARLIAVDVPTTPEDTPRGLAVLDEEHVLVSFDRHLVEVSLAGGAAHIRLSPDAPAERLLGMWGGYIYRVLPQGALNIVTLDGLSLMLPLGLGDVAVRAGLPAFDTRAGLLYLPLTLFPHHTEALPLDLLATAVVVVVDLETPRVQRVIWLDLADAAWHWPSAVALNADRSRLLVAYAASNRLTVLDLRTDQRLFTQPAPGHPVDTGYVGDGQFAFTLNNVDGTLALFDGRLFGPVDAMPATAAPLTPELRLGARLFHAADDPRIAWNNSLSCATCHIATNVIPSFIDRPDADLAAFLKAHVVNVQGGSGLPDVDMAALIAYLRARAPDGQGSNLR